MRRIEKRGAVNVLCDDYGYSPATRAEVEFFDEITRLRAEVKSLKLERQVLNSATVAAKSETAEFAEVAINAQYEVEALRADSDRLTGERDVAIGMLAYWCVAVDQNGTGWDDWDEHYKDAMYRPCPIRELLDKEINAARAAQGGET